MVDTQDRGLPVDLGATILKLLEEQGRSINQIRDKVADLGRLEERIAAHAAANVRAEASDQQLWTELREVEKRVRGLEQNGQRDYTRWQLTGGFLSRFAAPLLVVVLVALGAFWAGSRDRAPGQGQGQQQEASR